VCVRERECVCVSVCVCETERVCERERERESVCEREGERERVRVCVRERAADRGAGREEPLSAFTAACGLYSGLYTQQVHHRNLTGNFFIFFIILQPGGE